MTDMEKVINGLECCSQMEGDVCMKCPYANECDEEGLMAVSARLAADALSLLKEQEPLKHGRWELIDEAEPRRYGCSECRTMSWYGIYNYCPNCGAKMDLQEEDDAEKDL